MEGTSKAAVDIAIALEAPTMPSHVGLVRTSTCESPFVREDIVEAVLALLAEQRWRHGADR